MNSAGQGRGNGGNNNNNYNNNNGRGWNDGNGSYNFRCLITLHTMISLICAYIVYRHNGSIADLDNFVIEISDGLLPSMNELLDWSYNRDEWRNHNEVVTDVEDYFKKNKNTNEVSESVLYLRTLNKDGEIIDCDESFAMKLGNRLDRRDELLLEESDIYGSKNSNSNNNDNNSKEKPLMESTINNPPRFYHRIPNIFGNNHNNNNNNNNHNNNHNLMNLPRQQELISPSHSQKQNIEDYCDVCKGECEERIGCFMDSTRADSGNPNGRVIEMLLNHFHMRLVEIYGMVDDFDERGNYIGEIFGNHNNNDNNNNNDAGDDKITCSECDNMFDLQHWFYCGEGKYWIHVPCLIMVRLIQQRQKRKGIEKENEKKKKMKESKDNNDKEDDNDDFGDFFDDDDDDNDLEMID